jgi:hypothetical protein
MNPHDAAQLERVMELLSERAVGALTPETTRELQVLLDVMTPGERQRLEHLMSATELAMSGIDDPPTASSALPPSLREKLLRSAGAQIERFNAPPAPIVMKSRASWLPWLAAAACLALAVWAWLPNGAGSVDRLVAQVSAQSDVERIAFKPGVPEFSSTSGEVVWSTKAQRGYMRLKGVQVNDASKSQYQLWIIDPARDKRPVDGGVFDIVAGEVVVPIDAKLKVAPTGFAITREKPGGVVVSDGPLLMVALK